jgi:hypothetical protein
MGPGREGLRQWLAMSIDAFPMCGGQSHRGPFLGIPATGKTITVAAWTIDRFVDGKVAQSRIIMDTLGMMQQLGVVPAPDY